jgi:tricorn protease
MDAAGKPKPGKNSVNLSRVEVRVDPLAEWAQMYDEVWRIERDFFYDPYMHGCDWEGVREKYRPFLEHVSHRSDLNFLFSEMIGEMVVGHNYVGGGDMPDTERVSVGLLGADFAIEDGFYRIARIYTGENWNPNLRAPLTEPGVNVSEGDYILAVDGQPVRAPTNIFSLFEKTSGRQTVLLVSGEPNEDEARKVTVVPIGNDQSLRHRAWVEGNRRKVDEMTDGRVAYVYMPNTAGAGYTSFNRYYFAQHDKEGIVLDERFNGGGSVADYVIDLLGRTTLNYMATREGKAQPTPGATIEGPKAMIINEYAGSGGDAMPYYFRLKGLGKLVGKRTWGGLVGIYDYPNLIDGGFIAAPRIAFYGLNGEWIVENEGVSPDVEVEMLPKLVIAGQDPQLEKAVEIVLEELEQSPPTEVPVPAYPKRAQ